MKKKKLLAAFLAAVMVAGLLSGCGGNGKSPDGSGDGGQGKDEYVYDADFSDIDTGDINIDYINTCQMQNGTFYMYGGYRTGDAGGGPVEPMVDDDAVDDTADGAADAATGGIDMPASEPEVYESKSGFFTMDINGGNFKVLEGYEPMKGPEDAQDSGSYVNSFVVTPDGTIWVLENVYAYWYDIPDDFNPETDSYYNYPFLNSMDSIVLRKLDANGAEIEHMDLAQLLADDSEYFYVSRFIADKDGNLYLTSGDTLYVIDSEGNKLLELAADDWYINSIIPFADGGVAVTSDMWDEVAETSVLSIIPVDMEGKQWGEKISAPMWFYDVYAGSGDYDFYFNNGTGFFGFDMETGTAEMIFNWINVDVDSDYVQGVLPQEDGSVLALINDYNYDGGDSSMELAKVSKKLSSTLPQKTTLTYACMGLEYQIRKEILKFNKDNDAYRIEVMDYSQYSTNDDNSAGITKMNAEILAGNVPDIFSVEGLEVDRYAAKGYLEDLWPWIEQDTELGGREAVVQPVFNAMTNKDGKLYNLASSFDIITVTAPKALVGDKTWWDFNDFYTALQKMPEGASVLSQGMTSGDMLRTVCSLGFDRFVNWETGECDFNNEEFISMLKFVQLFPTEFDWDAYHEKLEQEGWDQSTTALMDGRQMLCDVSLYSLSDGYSWFSAQFGGVDISFIGYPFGEGSGSAFQVFGGKLAMSSTCKDKEAAWSFMRTFLTYDWQKDNYGTYQLCTNKKLFDECVKVATTPQYVTDWETGEPMIDPETGEKIPQYWTFWQSEDGQREVKYRSFSTPEEMEILLDLIDRTTRIYDYDDTIYEIVQDECAALFAGQKTPEQVAELIQSRVNIYVNEQR